MIKKLRTKIIVICFVSVCVVFLIGLAVLFGVGYARLNEERIDVLNGQFDKSDWSTITPSSISGIVLVEYDRATGEELTRLVGNNVSMSDEDITNVVQQVLSRHLNEGALGLSMVYSRRDVDNNVVRIGLYDRNVNNGKDVKYAVYSLIALLVGSVAYLLISYLLARIALRPVEATWKKQRQFVADASHELKTPLAVIKANTDLVLTHPKATVSSQTHWLENVRTETEQMTNLVNSLLFLAKNDEGLKEGQENVNFSECAESVVLGHEALIYEKNKTFTYEITPDLCILGSAGQLTHLVTILLDNAVKYSNGVGNINLTLNVSQVFVGKFAELKVSNDCEKLTEEQLDHLFDRFYTVDQSRDKTHTGSGLGLAIARTICENHQGEIRVDFSDGRITFTADIPVNRMMNARPNARHNSR